MYGEPFKYRWHKKGKLKMLEKIFSNPTILTLTLVLSIPIVAIIAYYWHRAQKKRSNDE
jgi:hypothetical protein